LEEQTNDSRAVGIQAKRISVVDKLCDIAGKDQNKERRE
jgi:hypothetical protein